MNSKKQVIKNKRTLSNNRGQGLMEYLILVAILSISSIGIVRTMSATINSQFTNITYALRGTKKKVEMPKVYKELYSKKGLHNFMNGTGKMKSEK